MEESARQGSACHSCGADPGGAAALGEGGRGAGGTEEPSPPPPTPGFHNSRRPHSSTSPPRSGYPLARCAPTGSERSIHGTVCEEVAVASSSYLQNVHPRTERQWRKTTV